MKKPVQILILLALFPMAGIAREETLEERKQRIVRKYLRERAVVTQSEMMVPSDLPEDERITDSEKFKDAEISLEREETSAKPYMPPPPQPRALQQRSNSNWLLDDTTEAETGFGMFGNTTDPSIDDGDSLWSSWGGDTGGDQSSEPRSTIDRGNDANQGYANGGRFQQDQRGYSTAGGTDLFGRTAPAESTTPDYESNFGLRNNRRTYGSSPDEGLLTTPFQQLDSYNPDNNQQRSQSGFGTGSSSGYQPYKSQYEQQREQRRQQWGTTRSEEEKQQEFQRPSQYQQFKDRNKSYDPLADDAYLNQQRR